MWNWKLSVLIRCLPTHRLWWMYLMVTCLDEQEQRKQAWLMVNRQDGMGVKSLCLGFAIPDFQKCEGIQYLITDNMPKVSMTKCFCFLQYSANVRGVILVSPEVYGNRAGFIPLWPLLNSSLLSDSSSRMNSHAEIIHFLMLLCPEMNKSFLGLSGERKHLNHQHWMSSSVLSPAWTV